MGGALFEIHSIFVRNAMQAWPGVWIARRAPPKPAPHAVKNGQIIKSGDHELAKELEKVGYEDFN